MADSQQRCRRSARRTDRQSRGHHEQRHSEGITAADDLRADYQVNVPQDAELQIHDDSGTVSVANVLGDYERRNDRSRRRHGGHGRIPHRIHRGRLVSVRALRRADRSEVDQREHSGLWTMCASDDVHAQTSTGNIVFNGEFLPNGSYRLKNYSGVIEVRFSPEDSFDLAALTSQGAA